MEMSNFGFLARLFSLLVLLVLSTGTNFFKISKKKIIHTQIIHEYYENFHHVSSPPSPFLLK